MSYFILCHIMSVYVILHFTSFYVILLHFTTLYVMRFAVVNSLSHWRHSGPRFLVIVLCHALHHVLSSFYVTSFYVMHCITWCERFTSRRFMSCTQSSDVIVLCHVVLCHALHYLVSSFYVTLCVWLWSTRRSADVTSNEGYGSQSVSRIKVDSRYWTVWSIGLRWE
jgi:hypothetical protein